RLQCAVFYDVTPAATALLAPEPVELVLEPLYERGSEDGVAVYHQYALGGHVVAQHYQVDAVGLGYRLLVLEHHHRGSALAVPALEGAAEVGRGGGVHLGAAVLGESRADTGGGSVGTAVYTHG